MRWKQRVKVASVITLYHLVQIRVAWREVLAGDRKVVAPVTSLEPKDSGAVPKQDDDN
jgi:hypothetical protein